MRLLTTVRTRVRPERVLDTVLLLAFGAAVFAVHDVSYLLGHPYWLDEAWVADSIRAPLGQLPFVTSSSPIGWTWLLRLVPGAGTGQRARLVPLIFCALAAMAGYVLGEELRLNRYVSGILVGSAALLGPAMLVRDDLKQYTAEAFAAVAIMALTARLENRWSRRRLAALGAFVALGLLIASTNLFVGAAAFGGLVLEGAIRRDGKRVVETLVAGVATGGACGLLYLLTVAPNVIPSLSAYWNAYYLSTHDLPSELHRRLDVLAGYMGYPHLFVVATVAAVGLVALAVTGRWALAAVLPVTVAINVVAALAKRYPFGDERTSTFWLVLVAVTMGIAAAHAAHLVSRLHWSGGAAVAAAVLVVWVLAVRPSIRAHSIPDENARDEIGYVLTHFRPGDVLILDYPSSYQFGFYGRGATPTYAPFPVSATGFLPEYPHQPWIVQMRLRTAPAVHAALDAAVARIRADPAPGGGRIWIVRSHQTPEEAAGWQEYLKGGDVQVLSGSSAPLLLYRPGR